MSFSAPDPPPPPEPVDPGEASLSYLFGDEYDGQGLGVASDEVQSRLLDAESKYGPQYILNALGRNEAALFGDDGQGGLLSLAARSAPVSEQIRADTVRAQREADIGDVELLGSRATEAFRSADPDQQALIRRQRALTENLYDRAQGLTPQQKRTADQQALEFHQARGRDLDNVSLLGQALGREGLMRQNRQEAQQAGGQLFGMQQATALDPFQAITGRPSQALGMNQNTAMQALGQSNNAGPSLFNPDAGINLALSNNANQANYDANIYGAQAAYQGQLISGLSSAFGQAAGAMGGGA